MTEAEWLNGEYVFPLADYLCRTKRLNRTKAGRRKFRLFACACCRRNWNLFEPDALCAAVVIAAERFADGEVPFSEVQVCERKLNIPKHGHETNVMLAARSLNDTNVLVGAISAATHLASAASRDPVLPKEATRLWSNELAQAAHQFRCIFGNPFRPVTFDPAWRTSDVVLLAQGIYDERAFDRMPFLADALQDAGCDNADILAHCRDASTPHARGCWVVDLVLGKQ
jgi:hypothetical protein